MHINSQHVSDKLTLVFGVIFELLKTSLLSFFLVLIGLPILEKWNRFQDFLKISDKFTLLGITCLVLFILLVSWSRVHTFWWKYKNTYKATISKFTFVDFIISIVYFALLIGVFSINRSLEVSQEIIVFSIVNSVLLLMYFLSSYYWPRKKSPLQSLSRSQRDEASDEPIQYLDEDSLNRKVFVQGLYKEIKELNIIESFVFGLYGKWGEGKTSVLNLLRIFLQNDEKFVVMSFEPWNFKDEEAVLKAFFNTLERTLNKEYLFPELRKLLFRYRELIASGLAGIGLKMDFGVEKETIDEVKQKIEGYIESTGKKLLVIIDEIDRLEEEEIRMIFKLVRSNSKFKNSIFLLSLDDTKTASKIDPNGSEFLEKIIQKPISLPKAEHNFISKYVLFSEHRIPQYTIGEVLNLQPGILVSTFGYITEDKNGLFEITESLEQKGASITVQHNGNTKPNFKISEKVFVEGIKTKEGIVLEDPESRLVPFRLARVDLLLEKMWRERKITLEQIAFFDKEFVHLYRTHIASLIDNYRDAKRFANSLITSYPPIAHEVSPFDFICLEIIKVFAKDVYNDIFENWWFYVDQRSEGDSFSNPYTFAFSSEQDKRKEETSQHVMKLLDSVSSTSHREVIKHVLDALFPRLRSSQSISESDRKDKRVFTSSFLKYFTLNIPSTELSDAFIEDELKTWENKPNEANLKVSFLKLHEQGKLVEFLDKIIRIYLEGLPSKLTTVLLSSISDSVKGLSKRRMGGFWDSEYDRALILVLRTLNSRIEKDQIQEELMKMINSTPDMLFAVDLILTTKKERGGDLFTIYDNVDNQSLRKVLAQRLEKHYIEDKKNVLEENPQGNGWLKILYQWSSNWSDETSPYKNIVAEYMVSILNTNPKKFIELLKSFNAGVFGNEWNMDYNKYSKVYDLVPLVALAQKQLKEKQLGDEQREILTKFISIVTSKSEEKNN